MTSYADVINSLENRRVPEPLSYESGKKEQFVVKPITAEVEKQKLDKLEWYVQLKHIFDESNSKGLVDDIIIHGSYGDFTQTHYSDIEITIVISENCLSNREKIKSFQAWYRKKLIPFILRVDPLQHHGCFYLWKEFIDCYDSRIMPLVAYRHCWSMRGRTIEFNVNHNANLCTVFENRFENTINSLLDYHPRFFRYGMNLYSIKRLLSNFFMLPVYFYQSEGLMLNKPDAISKIKSEKNLKSFHMALDEATKIREIWPKSKGWMTLLRRLTVTQQIPGGKIDRILVNLFRNRKIEREFEVAFLPYLKIALEELRQLKYENSKPARIN